MAGLLFILPLSPLTGRLEAQSDCLNANGACHWNGQGPDAVIGERRACRGVLPRVTRGTIVRLSPW